MAKNIATLYIDNLLKTRQLDMVLTQTIQALNQVKKMKILGSKTELTFVKCLIGLFATFIVSPVFTNKALDPLFPTA